MNIQGLILEDKILWDADLSLLDAYEHKTYLVSRVLSRGGLNDIKAILKFYTEEELKQAATSSRSIGEREMYFMSRYLGIDIKEFKCYELKQLDQSYLPGYSS
jgi:hypothetical protein